MAKDGVRAAVDGEPTFTVSARDGLALATARYHLGRARALKLLSQQEMVEAHATIAMIAEWQRAHPELVKGQN